ncbi:MAG: glycosyltransferase [Candidatus Pedobacter colombiensis]|uniref:Glycosyltransferase n=1 Tax=Candidatus Pedobacter colombiensis TaxID=3121371 RepID=A0AAJ6B7N7_9SPHI|nr:glycosyltransferase [Pedobacter sp.]WEK19696.1 MAG: glycosyltransferase [Pedobacter sp.]
MNRKVLIISPYFAPSNAADTHRIRMSLPYFAQNGWDAEVVIVNQEHSELMKDELLMQSIPAGIKIHTVTAFNKKWTSKLGLGSLALRSIWFYKQKVDQLLKAQQYDLIYFSTTQFPLCILGAYWKKRFGIPYVIDMQDPWHSDYYQNKPKHHQPPKYWFSYRLNKYMEPLAMKYVDGLISVSAAYLSTLQNRYARIASIPSAMITFGVLETDFVIAKSNKHQFKELLNPGKVNILYVGRGGADMQTAISLVFEALQKGLQQEPSLFNQLHFYFIGTSYAPSGQGVSTILPIAKTYQVQDHVTEITDRISFYHTLLSLQQADALFIPGSDDPQYTASKIYPYLLSKKPLLAIFHQNSSAIDIINECTTNTALIKFSDEGIHSKLTGILSDWANLSLAPLKLTEHIKKYSAAHITLQQTELFNRVIHQQ